MPAASSAPSGSVSPPLTTTAAVWSGPLAVVLRVRGSILPSSSIHTALSLLFLSLVLLLFQALPALLLVLLRRAFVACPVCCTCPSRGVFWSFGSARWFWVFARCRRCVRIGGCRCLCTIIRHVAPVLLRWCCCRLIRLPSVPPAPPPCRRRCPAPPRERAPPRDDCSSSPSPPGSSGIVLYRQLAAWLRGSGPARPAD